MMTLRSLALLLALLNSGSAFATTNAVRAEFSTGTQRVALIELFTSEGCSSCPPAERWLSRLRADPSLWKTFTPIAFHVDYWDYIGWKDRFARTEFSDRQRRYADEGNARFVYTPGIFRGGYEWQGWRTGKPLASDIYEVGELHVLINGEEITVQFDARDRNGGSLTVHVAVLGMNLETQVRAGENSGKTLRHDFVALGVLSVPLDKVGTGYRAITRLPETGLNANDKAIVAWVSEGEKQTPIQSVGGFLPDR